MDESTQWCMDEYSQIQQCVHVHEESVNTHVSLLISLIIVAFVAEKN